MDKFTVDLEKVLDEFEYSEGREESVVPASVRNHSYSRNSPKTIKPPAAAYRRPAFEPINLADADFSADPSSVSGQIINVAKHKNFSEQKYSSINENDFIKPIKNDLNVSLIEEKKLQDNNEENIKSDETPDLLDSNSLKSQNGFDQDITDKAQLPDITSVHSYSEPEEEINVVEELDLIKRNSIVDTSDVNGLEDLPPIVGIDTVISALPDLHITPLTFDSVEIPDSDIISYLDNLDIESNLIDNTNADEITDCIVKTEEKSEQNLCIKPVEEKLKNSEIELNHNNSESSPETSVNPSKEFIAPTNVISLSTEKDLTLKEDFSNSLDVTSSVNKPEEEEESNLEVNKTDIDEDGPVSLTSLSDIPSILTTSTELDTKQKYSLCPDISDEEPEEVNNVNSGTSINHETSINFINSETPINLVNTESLTDNSDIDNGNVIKDKTKEVNIQKEQDIINQVLNSVKTDTEIKEVVCNSVCDNIPEEKNIEINKVIIRVPSEDLAPENNLTDSSTHEANQINSNSVNDNINENVLDNAIVNNTLHYQTENTTFNTLNCLPVETSQFVDNISQSVECLDNTLNSNSDELAQNLQNSETEREEIDNRDNEEKAELGLDSENNDTSGNTDFYYQGDSSSSEATSAELDMKPSRPSTLPLPHSHIVTDSEESPTPSNSSSPSVGGVMSPEERSLGKRPPYWVPDTETDSCMLCNAKFTVIKRRHHCRACGLVLCSKCCNLKAPLEYMGYAEARVCQPCFNIIYRVGLDEGRYNRGRQPNPNNPMEYCSTVPPLQQVSSSASAPPAVFVPTSVLKREGRARSDTPKQVMFSDGIRPGGDLTELDGSNDAPRLLTRRSFNRKQHSGYRSNNNSSTEIEKRPLDPSTQSFIPAGGNLPPMVNVAHGNVTFLPDQLTSVGSEPVKFAINYNLFINVQRVKLDCCVNREVWSVCSEGLCLVGQDEIALILETLPEETLPHVDIFHLINYLWKQAALGSTASEMCFTAWFSNSLLSSNDHGGFLYIRPSLQCTSNLLLPSQPYLIALLVHRWETGWARLFPLRLVLRLGAEYRYYPCPLVSVRNRQPLYTDIGHTIIKILADFRKFSYSLATVRGMVIHLEDKQTTILFPRNRYDQVTRALNNSNESVLAFGANLSLDADSHLVCIQGAKDENTYHTEAINIHNKPRKVTGASFVVFNGALKGSGDTGRSSILEDGLMVHLTPDRMAALRSALRSMHDFSLPCGPDQDETVLIHWTSDDTNFNLGVESCIDKQPLNGVPSIRVHNGTDYTTSCRLIRWTEVFILQCEDGVGEPVDVSRVSESISRATCSALIPLLDSLATADLNPLAIRATIHQDNVGYDAGSCGEKLPTQYMKRLDDELIPVLHQAAMSQPSQTPLVLELIFRIMLMP